MKKTSLEDLRQAKWDAFLAWQKASIVYRNTYADLYEAESSYNEAKKREKVEKDALNAIKKAGSNGDLITELIKHVDTLIKKCN